MKVLSSWLCLSCVRVWRRSPGAGPADGRPLPAPRLPEAGVLQLSLAALAPALPRLLPLGLRLELGDAGRAAAHQCIQGEAALSCSELTQTDLSSSDERHGRWPGGLPSSSHERGTEEVSMQDVSAGRRELGFLMYLKSSRVLRCILILRPWKFPWN